MIRELRVSGFRFRVHRLGGVPRRDVLREEADGLRAGTLDGVQEGREGEGWRAQRGHHLGRGCVFWGLGGFGDTRERGLRVSGFGFRISDFGIWFFRFLGFWVLVFSF